MSDKKSIGVVVLVVYLFLLMIFHFNLSLKILMAAPKMINLSLNTSQTLRQGSPMRDFLLINYPLDLFKSFLILTIWPATCFFLIQYRNWARLMVISICLFVLLQLTYLFSTTYSTVLSLRSNSPQNTIMGGNLVETMLAGNTYEIGFLLQFILFLLPVIYLINPKIKEQFK